MHDSMDSEDWTSGQNKLSLLWNVLNNSGHKLRLKAIKDEFLNVQKKNSPADEYQSFNMHAKHLQVLSRSGFPPPDPIRVIEY